MQEFVMPLESNPVHHQPHLVRLLIVDDMPQVREELLRLLELTDLVQVVGEAANGQEAIDQAEVLRPDVVLIDLEMPVLDGWEALRQIKQRQLAKRVVVLSIHVDTESKQRAKHAGADAFVPKGTGIKALLSAIVAHGDMKGEEEKD
jgi:DNA-binding NarL/FixJ family response regulator